MEVDGLVDVVSIFFVFVMVGNLEDATHVFVQ